MEVTIMYLTGIPVKFLCYSRKAILFLRRFQPQDEPKGMEAMITIDVRDMVPDRISEQELLADPFLEYCLLIEAAADALLTRSRCFIHGTVFVWKEKAWILTARSGTGKTTQYRNLKELYGNEVFCLNGDKPGLEFREDGEIIVYDSPWRGKENEGTSGAAYPLAGIILLQQQQFNEIQNPEMGEKVVFIYQRLFSTRQKRSTVHLLCRMEENLLKTVPVLLLRNRGDLESTRLLYKTIERLYSEKHNVKN